MSTGARRLPRLLAAGIGLLMTTAGLACGTSTPASQAPLVNPSASAPASSPTPATAEILGARWTQAWTDTFNGPAGQGVSAANWRYDDGHGIFGTGEVETTTSSPGNVSLDGAGNLNITALASGSAWTTGRITTTRQFSPPAGGEMLITASIKQPDPADGIGYWPGFWMIGSGTWPLHGEIDIMEDVNAARQVAGTMHCGNLTERNADGTTGPCHETTGLTSDLRPCPDCQTSYNTYSLVIDRRKPGDESVAWYIGGLEFYSVSEATVGAAAWNEAIDHGDFSVILDIAMGGGYPDVICHCTSPTPQTSSGGTMSVAYVSVYTN